MDSTIIIKKKKVHGGHGHHGGSWKVAYADFVTAMMAFFMVMWIIGLSDSSKHEIASYFKDPFGYLKQSNKSDKIFSMKGVPETKSGLVYDQAQSKKDEEKSLKAVEKKVESDLSKTPDLKELAKYVDMQVTSEGLRIELVEGKGSVFFVSGSAVIRPEAMKLVQRIAPILASTKRAVIVEGHTDAQPYAGTAYSNIDLSIDRARALQHALLDHGMELQNFGSVQGLGSTQLRDPSHPLSFTNRRVSILVPFKQPKPTGDGLPKDSLRHEIQGAFKSDITIAP